MTTPETKMAATPDATSGEEKGDRQRWSSRTAFYFASVGAAVGFGNVWRFPGYAAKYGGGAFFIPYIVALVIIGIPLAILEIGFGQFFQTGDIGVFGGFHPRLRGIGLSSVACAFMLDTYYVVLIAWVVNAFFDTFKEDSIWGNTDITGSDAVGYFVEEIIGAGTVTDPDLRPSRLVGNNVGYCFLVWFIIFLCVVKGVKTTGRITYLTMGMPVIVILIFFGKAISLEGSGDGIKQYIGIWDLSILTEQPEVWSIAVAQIFFSIGLTFGILTAYGSHCKRDEPVVLNATVVALANSLYSFIAGFAVFAALGHLAHLENTSVTDETVIQHSSFALVFGTWPVVMNKLPGDIHWVRLLFFNLILLGIDSAFSFQEAFVTVLQDSIYFENTARWKLCLGLCFIGFLFSLMYCTDSGLYFLDVVDFYINFVMILVGFFQAFGSAWAYGILGQFEKCGKTATLAFMAASFFPIFLACGLWYGLESDDAGWIGAVAGFVLYGLGLVIVQHFVTSHLSTLEDSSVTSRQLWWELYFGNIQGLRAKIEPVIGRIPFSWIFLIKHFIPHALIVLFVNLASSTTGFSKDANGDDIPGTDNSQFGHYGHYSTDPYQVLGILTFVFAAFLFLAGLVVPRLYAPLAKPQTPEAMEELEQYMSKEEYEKLRALYKYAPEKEDSVEKEEEEAEEAIGDEGSFAA